MPFDPDNFWGSYTRDFAYQLAWAVLCHDIEADDVAEIHGDSFACVKYDGLTEMVHAILSGSLGPEDAPLVLKAESLGGGLAPGHLVEADWAPVLKTMFRKEFILNPDPEKRAWHAFLAKFHGEVDPTGLTTLHAPIGQYGMFFRAKERVGTPKARQLNEMANEAARQWNFEPVGGEPTCHEIRDEVDRTKMSTMNDQELYEYIMEMGSCCSVCMRHVRSLVTGDRSDVLQRIEDEDEEASAALCYDAQGNNLY
jgi:bacterioferritin-associated ferredoxin